MTTLGQPPLKTCPACDARLVPGRSACVKCGLPNEKMPELAAARQHALRKGLQKTLIENRQPSRETQNAVHSLLGRETLKLVGGAVVLLVVLIGGYFALRAFRGPGVEPWKAFPTDGKTAVANFIADIHSAGAGDKAAADRAFQAIALSQRLPDSGNDAERWGYVFQDVDEYLTGEFGPAWNTIMNVEPADPAKGNAATLYIVTIGTEQLHVDLEPQTPPAPAAAPNPPHYGILEIREITLMDALHGDPVRGPAGFLTHVYGADGSAEQLRSIFARNSPLGRLTPTQIKRLLLPIVRNPRATALKDAIYRLSSVRQDATVRARLEKITKDARYPMDAQKAAQEVLDVTVDESILIELGVS